ncbi:MAG TPA: T9SS type A sorting domain-containing protein, partial [Ferruginibacter sp.]|nr:T9SS type A sorting domain-containing protein [Ferruginibacter sp.]
YRLKQVDKDGQYKYSAVVPVLFNYSIVKELKINPNPVINQLNLALTVSESASLTCKIYTAEGRQVKVLNAAAWAGRNIIASDVSNLASGIYIVVLISNNERIAETRFIKQ